MTSRQRRDLNRRRAIRQLTPELVDLRARLRDHADDLDTVDRRLDSLENQTDSLERDVRELEDDD